MTGKNANSQGKWGTNVILQEKLLYSGSFFGAPAARKLHFFKDF